jgi:putative endopeptidase
MKKKLAMLLATLMTFSLSVNAFAGELTKGEYAEMLLEQAKEYNTSVKLEDIIKDTSETATSKKLTKAEALVMLRRAFGTLPTLKGDLARSAPEVQTYTDLPFWAVDDVTALSNAGVLSEESGEIGAGEYVTEDYTDLMASRMYRLFGSNVKDDYYATVNKDYLENSVIEDGESEKNITNDTQDKVYEVVSAILADIIIKEHSAGSIEQKIKDFYLTATNEEARNRLGIKPIKPYLNSLKSVKTDAELVKFAKQLATDTTVDCLVGFGVTQQYDDNETYLPVYQGYTPTLSQEDYEDEDGKALTVYKSYLVKILKLAGESDKTAEKKAQEVIDFEYELSKNITPNEEYDDFESTYNYYSLSDLQERFKSYDLGAIAKAHDFDLSDKQIVVNDPKGMEFYAGYFDGKHTELLKTLAEVSILSAYTSRLDEDFVEAGNLLAEAVYGVNYEYTIQSIAYYITLSTMDDYLGSVYCERELTDEKRSEIEKMVTVIRDCYKERIKELDWMSDETKSEAIKKLDNIGIIIGGYDETMDSMDGIEILGTAAGDDAYIKNVYSILKAVDAQRAELINGDAEIDGVGFSTYEVNAMYADSLNTMIIPAGIMNAPFYDESLSIAENYGGIGVIIGHEMSHAFDTTGAKFDENGQYKNWWTDEDYAKFNELSKKVESYYDGAEAATGLAVKGKLSIDENIADIGGLEVALDALKKVSDGTPDYDAFFRSYALSFVGSYDRAYMSYLVKYEVHAPDSIRVNYPVKSTDEFYEAYDVEDGDGMYVKDEDRIRIW